MKVHVASHVKIKPAIQSEYCVLMMRILILGFDYNDDDYNNNDRYEYNNKDNGNIHDDTQCCINTCWSIGSCCFCKL